MILSITFIAILIVLCYVFKHYIILQRALKSINNLSGYRTFLAPTTIYNEFLPIVPGFSVGPQNLWRKKHEPFRQWNCDAYASVSIWPRNIDITFADAEAIKEMAASRALFRKPVRLYRVTKFFGENIVASEGDEWKKHRKICAPAFAEPSNRLVYVETVKIMNELFEDIWNDQKEIKVNDVTDLTVAITLMIIGVAGFGRQVSWKEDSGVSPGHIMPFRDALVQVSSHPAVKIFCPEWAYKLHPKLKRVGDAFKDVPKYLQEMVDERRYSGNVGQRYDLLSRLIDASGQETGKEKMLDNEIISNSFIFLLAGHETTAHAISFALALLALHPNEQETLYQHVKSVIGSGRDRDPAYEDLEKLTYTMAVFYETMRMFPPVVYIAKEAAENTTVTVGNISGKRQSIVIPKGAHIVWNIAGLHYNPRYWKDPYDFRPQRFNENWPRDAFLGFSSGARSCIGRRFAETETLLILSMLIARYKVEIMDEPGFRNETYAQRKERVLRTKFGVTLTPVRIPLVFKAR